MPRVFDFRVVDPVLVARAPEQAIARGASWAQVETRTGPFSDAIDIIDAWLPELDLAIGAWRGEGPGGRLPYGYLDSNKVDLACERLPDHISALSESPGRAVLAALRDTTARARALGRAVAIVMQG